MNIFCVDSDPVLAARQLCDKHVVKMPVESCQLLQTCFTLEVLADKSCPRTKNGRPRRHFNPKHPCSIWVRQSRDNMFWLIQHTQAMFEEKYARYPQVGRHFSHDFLDWVVDNIDKSFVHEGPFTDFALAINPDSKCRKISGFDSLSRVNQYRLFYIHDKNKFATWKRNKPNWYK